MEKLVLHSRFNMGPRVSFACKGPSRTKQSSRDECDINLIMAKFAKTGAVDHFAKHGESYGFASAVDFHSAMNVIARGSSMFEELPSAIRVRFNDSPAEFLAFVQDDGNLDEMRDMGLANKLAPDEAAEAGEVAAAAMVAAKALVASEDATEPDSGSDTVST